MVDLLAGEVTAAELLPAGVEDGEGGAVHDALGGSATRPGSAELAQPPVQPPVRPPVQPPVQPPV